MSELCPRVLELYPQGKRLIARGPGRRIDLQDVDGEILGMTGKSSVNGIIYGMTGKPDVNGIILGVRVDGRRIMIVVQERQYNTPTVVNPHGGWAELQVTDAGGSVRTKIKQLTADASRKVFATAV